MASPPSVGPSSSRELLVHGELKDWRLRRLRVLGKGSYGLATLVEDVESGEHLVAKEINMQMFRKANEVEDIMREIRILKSVRHPNIVAYRDCCKDDASLCMTILMEFCDDGDLAQKMAQRRAAGGGLSDDELGAIFVQLLMAIRCLHLDHRILHRDIKAQNVFLMSDGTVKLGDFGVSTVLGQSADFAKTFCGSPYYLAPELVAEQPYNGKADLWAIGVVMYECATLGRRPFHGKNLVALVMQISRAEYAPLTEDCAASAELRETIHLLLQRDPEARPTIRRLLRAPYTASKLLALPRHLLLSEEYDRHLNSRRVLRQSMQQQQQREAREARGGGPRAPALDPELEQWLAADRAELAKLEQQFGCRPETFGDGAGASQRQQRAMQGLSAAAAPAARGTGNGGEDDGDDDDDALWNSKYADDDFESFEEDPETDQYKNWTCMNTLPMKEMSFSL